MIILDHRIHNLIVFVLLNRFGALHAEAAMPRRRGCAHAQSRGTSAQGTSFFLQLLLNLPKVVQPAALSARLRSIAVLQLGL